MWRPPRRAGGLPIIRARSRRGARRVSTSDRDCGFGNCYASRAFRRDVVDNEGWPDWREGNEESLLLVWWDRAEIPSRTWSDTAFLFVPGGAGGQLTTPLVAVISPDGMRAGPVMANSGDLDLLDFDDFTSAVDERLEAWGDVPPGELV